jgi:internalin A
MARRSQLGSRVTHGFLTAATLALSIGVAHMLLGCDEPASAPAPKPKATAEQAAKAAPAPTAVPEQPAEPAKAKAPKKTLADCPKGNKITFDNPEIEAQVRLKAKKEKGDITTADLGRIRSLNVSQAKLTELDICLFSHMKELRELFLGKGEIDDLSPIAGATKLESLRASLNPITDLKPLAGMTKLDRLDLAHTQVSDLSPISGLTSLTELLLDNTPVSDVKPIASLTSLEVLVLKDTRVKDVAPLTALKKLKTLDLRGAPVDNSAAVARPGLRVQEF